MKKLHYRKGSVLIVVLVMTAFILTLVMALHEKSSESFGGVIDVQAENQGAIYAGSALTVIRQLMSLDDESYDAPTDQWATLPSIPVKNGYVTVTITPADDRLPVNALTQKDETKYERVKKAFEYIFSELDYDNTLWWALKDWVSSSESTPMSTEIHDTTFNSEGSSYTAKFSGLSSLYEMRMIPGFPSAYKDLSKYLCVGDTEPKININFADKLTIQALLPELDPYVDEIIEKRAETPFKSKDELYNMLGSGNRDIYTAILPYFDVKSTFFYVKIEVDIIENTQYYHALLKRNGKRFTVLRYIEGRSISYF